MNIKTVVGVVTNESRKGFLGTKNPLWGGDWKNVKLGAEWTLDDVWTYTVGCHLAHLTEFLVALTAWFVFFSDGTWQTECADVRVGWMARVVAFNLTCEVMFVGGWHWLVYVSCFAAPLLPAKFNPMNPYEKTNTNIRREVTYTTLGWLQSAAWQILMMHLWASGRVPFYAGFFSHPLYSLFILAAVTYWREIHFYWCHRGMHPWFDRRKGLMDGDVGAFLYRHAHSLHHKSYNPGPWSGLSMHPIEHFLYYSCAWLPPLLFATHPLHFLYAKFHADIAPIGGHDGYDEPSANGDFHWLHHAKFECNYGVPFPIDFDKMFGTWVDYKEFKANGRKLPKAMAKQIGGLTKDVKKTE